MPEKEKMIFRPDKDREVPVDLASSFGRLQVLLGVAAPKCLGPELLQLLAAATLLDLAAARVNSGGSEELKPRLLASLACRAVLHAAAQVACNVLKRMAKQEAARAGRELPNLLEPLPSIQDLDMALLLGSCL